MVQNLVCGHTYLELALALSVTALVACTLKAKNLLSDLPIWALIGKSSTGKTTALRLMASIWGSPEDFSGMIYDLHATQNAIYALMEQNQGLPILIDETSGVPEWDFSKFLYHLPKGHDKVRCQTNGMLQQTKLFSGAVIFTGEKSLFDQSNKNDGLYARLIEFELPWTDSARHAEELEYACRCYNGTAAVLLAHSESISEEPAMTVALSLVRRTTSFGK